MTSRNRRPLIVGRKDKRRPLIVSRRDVLKGTVAAGAVATVAAAASGCAPANKDTITPAPRVVDPGSADDILEKFTTKDVAMPLVQEKVWQLPLGTVLREATGVWFPILQPPAAAAPLVVAGRFSIKTGAIEILLTEALSSEPNWIIYDVRCSDTLFAWVELNIAERSWRLFAAEPSRDAVLTRQVKLWEATSDYVPPAMAVEDNYVWWQVQPSPSGKKRKEHSFCYRWVYGDANARPLLESPGSFGCALSVADKVITLVPRMPSNRGIYYGMAAYRIHDDLSHPLDQLVLPQGVRPFHVARIDDVFAFSIEATYASAGLLGKMGTYFGSGNASSYVTLVREPAAGIAGRGGVFIVKSRASYYVIDVNARQYSVLPSANRSLDYGEYPATIGRFNTFVTFSTVKDPETGYPMHVCVRTFNLP